MLRATCGYTELVAFQQEAEHVPVVKTGHLDSAQTARLHQGTFRGKESRSFGHCFFFRDFSNAPSDVCLHRSNGRICHFLPQLGQLWSEPALVAQGAKRMQSGSSYESSFLPA